MTTNSHTVHPDTDHRGGRVGATAAGDEFEAALYHIVATDDPAGFTWTGGN